MFDNRKIKQIESMPDGDSLLIIWVKLLCLAGNVNDGGYIYLTKEIPYTDEMLATQFNRPLQNIRLALQTFKQFGMVEIVDNMIYLSSWQKYQNTDKLAEIREQNRLRKQAQRLREKEQKLLPSRDSHVTQDGQVTPSHALDIEEDKDIDKKKNISKKPIRHKYGEYNNVLLSDDDMDKLKAEFPTDWQQRIQRLSEYIASSGKSYKNHLATIRNWARREKPARTAVKPAAGDMDDLDELF